MSVRAIDWIFRQDIRPATVKFLAVAFADNCNDHGVTYPSVSHLCIKTSLDDRTVRDGIEKLLKFPWFQDTGKKVGQTGQIRVFRMVFDGVGQDPMVNIGKNSKTPKNEGLSKTPNFAYKTPKIVPKDSQFCLENRQEPSLTLKGDSGFAVRVRAIMHRKESIGFSEKESKSFKKIARKISDDDLCMVERYYKANWPPNRDRNMLRHDLYTFLNNFHGEVDRALQWCEKHPLRSKTVRYSSPSEPIVEVPAASPEDAEKFVASFEAHFKRLPFGYSRVDGKVVYSNGAK